MVNALTTIDISETSLLRVSLMSFVVKHS